MGIDLTTLLKAGTRGLAGYQQGRRQAQDDADERERRARLDLIAERIANANVANLEASARDRAEAKQRQQNQDELAGLEANRAEALLNERAAGFQQQFGEDVVPTGLHPQIAVERGEAEQKRRDAAAARADRQPTGRQLKVVRGPDGQPVYTEYDPQTGAFTPTDQRPAGTQARTTEGQAKAQAQLELLPAAVEVLDAVGGAPDRFQAVARKYGIGEALSDRAQAEDLASRQVTDAYLRMTTGAAYNETEFQNARRITSPMPGDSPATLERKRQIRRQIIQAMQRIAQASTASPDEEEPNQNEDDVLTPYLKPAAGR
jgi:hypothetical protein